jgi:SAM-dependent methyltransferase
MGDQVGREPQYDVLADEFLDHARDGFWNAYYDRPACLALLGDVAGKRVLDAACGPGLYAAELARRGAEVVGFDQSQRMVEICRTRAGGGDFRVHDLCDPIDWLPDASVDLALCALAIEYVDDRVAALREMRRVLRPGGALVLSRMHPTGDWLRNGGSYFDVRIIHTTWRGCPVRNWLAPLETTPFTRTQRVHRIPPSAKYLRPPLEMTGHAGADRATQGLAGPQSFTSGLLADLGRGKVARNA